MYNFDYLNHTFVNYYFSEYLYVKRKSAENLENIYILSFQNALYPLSSSVINNLYYLYLYTQKKTEKDSKKYHDLSSTQYGGSYILYNNTCDMT